MGFFMYLLFDCPKIEVIFSRASFPPNLKKYLVFVIVEVGKITFEIMW